MARFIAGKTINEIMIKQMEKVMESTIAYLKSNYLLENDFLLQNKCLHDSFCRWQQSKLFPQPSYITKKTYDITSYFGTFEFNDVDKWYPVGLCEWVDLIRTVGEDFDALKDIFINRYKSKVNELNLCGLSDDIYMNTSTFDRHLEDEWQHFLNGTYGVCTKDCSPEQIATKDLTVRVIDRITDKQQASTISIDEEKLLVIAVNFLDAVSSSFLPPERERSSRKKCIELVREKYINSIG